MPRWRATSWRVSTALEKVADFGIDPDNAFGFWDWVGGRYSMDSAIGLSLVHRIGPERFSEMLAASTPSTSTSAPRRLLPTSRSCWACSTSGTGTFLGAQTHAVLPYAQQLHRFPAYLQQLTMESNGKGVRWDGSPVTTETARCSGASPAPTASTPSTSSSTRAPGSSRPTSSPSPPGVPPHEVTPDGGHRRARAVPRQLPRPDPGAGLRQDPRGGRAEGVDEELVTARTFPGNRPTGVDHGPALTRRCSGSWSPSTSTRRSCRARSGASTASTSGASSSASSSRDRGHARGGGATRTRSARKDASTQSLIRYYQENRRR